MTGGKKEINVVIYGVTNELAADLGVRLPSERPGCLLNNILTSIYIRG